MNRGLWRSTDLHNPRFFRVILGLALDHYPKTLFLIWHYGEPNP
jgi:hypothetical protein